MPASESTFIQLTLSRRLLARADEAAKVEGITRPEFIRAAIRAACERSDALAARRERTAAKQGRGR